MLRKLRPRLTYANVVSTLCLFILLGGSAYAVDEWNSSNIQDNTLTGADIKGKASPGFVEGTLDTFDIKNKSLLSSDVAANTLTAGELAPNSASVSEIKNDAVDSSKVKNNSLTGLDIDESSLDLGRPSAPAYAHIVNGQVDEPNSKNVHITQAGNGYQCMTASWTYKFEFNGELNSVSTFAESATAQIDVAGADTRDRVGLTLDPTAVGNVCTPIQARTVVFQINKDGAAATLPYYIVFS